MFSNALNTKIGSPEAPVPVVTIRERHSALGGAANVAANVSAMGATCLLVGVVGDRQGVDVGEGPGAQAVEGVLAAPGQAHDGGARGERADHDHDGADDGEARDEAHVDAVGGDPAVDRLLHEDGHHQPTAGADHGEGDGEGGALAQLGAAPPAAAQRLEGAPLGGFGAHAALRSRS